MNSRRRLRVATNSATAPAQSNQPNSTGTTPSTANSTTVATAAANGILFPTPCNNNANNSARVSAMMSAVDSGSCLPHPLRLRLYDLFVQIEREFEQLYAENQALSEKLERVVLQTNNNTNRMVNNNQNNLDFEPVVDQPTLQPSVIQPQINNPRPSTVSMEFPLHPQQTTVKFQQQASTPSSSTSRGLYAHKLRSHTSKLRAQTNRLMSNLKGQTLTCTPLRRYVGHKDGIWEVSVSKMGLPILGTASADHTALIWGVHSGQPLMQYAGHTGSVNSLRFHPTKELVITSSGDGTVHIWQCAVHLHNESSSGRVAAPGSSDEEGEPNSVAASRSAQETHKDKEENLLLQLDEENEFSVLRTPLRALTGHNGVAIAADWLPGGEQAVTAGWDRLACIWDTSTGQLVQTLAGHDEELTHASAHPISRLVVTSSKDCTFRLWDFRESFHSVSVFQGHTDTVTSAVFTYEANKVISSSDDRSARIWDLRNMRTPVAVVQGDASVNRLSVSHSGLIAIPFDNRNVRIYDLNGQRIARLPRSSRQGHSRMVCGTAWAENDQQTPNLFTCGFDRVTLGWSIQPREVKGQQQLTVNVEDQANRPRALSNANSPNVINQ